MPSDRRTGWLGGSWRIGLRNPFDPSRPLGEIALSDRGLGTSGTAFQRFEADGRIYGHIVDPRTGEPPEHGPASVSVLAPTAAEADALSTAFYLMGPAATSHFLADRPDVGAIFVMDGDADRPPRLVLLNVSRPRVPARSRRPPGRRVLLISPPSEQELSPGRPPTLLPRLLRRTVPDPPAHGDRLALLL